MLHNKLINPKSIAVIGASNNLQTPGGQVLKNLIETNFQGKLYAVNPKESKVQGIKCYEHASLLPETDTAIIAIAARFVLDTVEILASEKNTKGFIVFSAGFSEQDAQGSELENQLVETIDAVGGSLLGPNNIGLINKQYAGVFTSPIPKLSKDGVDFLSGSGATAVFIIEAAMEIGLSFSSVYSVGNSAQIGIEELLEYLDLNFDPKKSSKIKLLYLESIKNPTKLFKHAHSLISKGCKIAAIKAGGTEAGGRAAGSHTGALVSSEAAVNALFYKAGIVRCYGRNELISLASVWTLPQMKGKNLAIITHAGGPAVMLTDCLSERGFNIPEIQGPKAQELEDKLFPGSSVANPIDFLATGTAEQLGTIIDYCENHFPEIDAMAVIFGSPGLAEVYDVYELLHEKMRKCIKPIYPILPSLQNAKNEIQSFIQKGNIYFPDEVLFGRALAKSLEINKLETKQNSEFSNTRKVVQGILKHEKSGYLSPEKVQKLLKAVAIPTVSEFRCTTIQECLDAIQKTGYPVVLKAIGPVHKSDIGGIALNLQKRADLVAAFERIAAIKQTEAVLLQPMRKGLELFIGAKKEMPFGHLVLFGAGGIYVEVLKDVRTLLAPVSEDEARHEISKLKLYELLKGVRNQNGIQLDLFANIIQKVSLLVSAAPEIIEMDLNPLIGTTSDITCVDARICIEKQKKN